MRTYTHTCIHVCIHTKAAAHRDRCRGADEQVDIPAHAHAFLYEYMSTYVRINI